MQMYHTSMYEHVRCLPCAIHLYVLIVCSMCVSHVCIDDVLYIYTRCNGCVISLHSIVIFFSYATRYLSLYTNLFWFSYAAQYLSSVNAIYACEQRWQGVSGGGRAEAAEVDEDTVPLTSAVAWNYFKVSVCLSVDLSLFLAFSLSLSLSVCVLVCVFVCVCLCVCV